MDDETAVTLARLALEAGMVRNWKTQTIVTKDRARGMWQRKEKGVFRELWLPQNIHHRRSGSMVNWFDFSTRTTRYIELESPAGVAAAMLLLKVWGEEYKGSNNHDRD